MGQQDQGVLRLGDVKQDFTGRGKIRIQDCAVVVHHVVPQRQEQEEGEKKEGPEFRSGGPPLRRRQLPQADEPVKVKGRERLGGLFLFRRRGCLYGSVPAVFVVFRFAFAQSQIEKEQAAEAEGKQEDEGPESASARIVQASERDGQAGKHQRRPQEDGQGVSVNAYPPVRDMQPVRNDVASQGRNQGQKGECHEPPEFRTGGAAPEFCVMKESLFPVFKGGGRSLRREGCGCGGGGDGDVRHE